MDDTLWRNREFVAFRQETESRLRQLDAEISRLKWQRTIEATERSTSFWFGLVFFTGVLLVVVFAKDWT